MVEPNNSNVIAMAICIIRPKLCMILLNHHNKHTDNPSLHENARCQGDGSIQSDVPELDSGRLDARVPRSAGGQAC